MIRIILGAIVFFLIIAITPYFIGDKGYILIAMGKLTIESTVVTGIIMLVGLFILLLVLLKLFKGGFKFGNLAWHKLVFANRRKALREFNQGISAYLLHDYVQAELLMAKCAEKSGHAPLAWLVAASAAQQQANNKNALSNSAHYLQLIENYNGEKTHLSLEIMLVTVDLFMQRNDFHQARKAIDANHKLIGHDARLLSLEINLCIKEQRFAKAAEYLPSARKQKTITVEQIAKWQTIIYKALFTEQITQHDQQHLYDFWQSLAKKTKQQEAVLLVYCQVLAQHQLTAPLNKLLLAKIKKTPSDSFLKQVRLLPISDADELIHLVQKHLQRQEDNPQWLSLLAHLAYNSKQWKMADKAFHRLFSLGDNSYDKEDVLAYAQVLQQQGLYQQANELLLKLLSLTRHCEE